MQNLGHFQRSKSATLLTVLVLALVFVPVVPTVAAQAQPSTCTTTEECLDQLAEVLGSLGTDQLEALGAAVRTVLGSLPNHPIDVPGVGQIGGDGQTIIEQLAKLLAEASLIAGLGFAIAALLKYQQHRLDPTQAPFSMPIALTFIAAALIFAPSLFKSIGETMFGPGGIEGLTNFGG